MVIIHIISGLERGGAEKSLLNLISLSKFNHKIINLGKTTTFAKKFEKKNCTVINLNINGIYSFLKGILSTIKIFKKDKKYIVQSWMYHACLFISVVNIIYKSKFINWIFVASNLSKNLISDKTRFIIFLLKFFCQSKSIKIIACDEVTKNAHIKLGFNKNKISVLYFGIPIRDTLIPSYGNDIINISCVARFDPQKDHKTLIEAFNMVKIKRSKFKLYLIGRGINKENSYLTNLINKSNLILNEDIYLCGEHNNIEEFLSKINLNILTSVGEGLPLSLLECMSLGIPCISTNVGETKKIISNHGWLVEKSNLKNITENIIEAINEWENNNTLWQSRRLSGYHHVKLNFSIEGMVTNFEKIWLKKNLNN